MEENADLKISETSQGGWSNGQRTDVKEHVDLKINVLLRICPLPFFCA